MLAQQSYQQDFNTAGGVITGSTFNISYSIGQPIFEEFQATDIRFTNGFQQGGGEFSLVLQTDSVQCHGTATGSATVFAIGGTPNYTYLWNTTPPQTTPNATGFAVGNHSVIVTDALGYSADTTFTIFQPSVLTAISAYYPASQTACLNGIVQFDLNVAGGTQPYSYSWTNSQNMDNPDSPNPIVNPVTTFSYVATVTDNNGCTVQAGYNLLYSETGGFFEGIVTYNGLPVGLNDVQVFLFPTDYTLGSNENFDNAPDSSFTDANGHFLIHGNDDDVYYYLLARPRNLPNLPLSICTYYGDSTFEYRWQLADSVFSNCGDTTHLNLPLLTQSSEVGIGHLSGFVRWDAGKTETNNDPIPLIDVVVEKDSVAQGFTVTDTNGYYEFNDLPVDGSCYRLYVNFVGLNHVYIDNNPYNPCLTPSDTSVENLNFWIDTLNGGGSNAGIFNYNPATGIVSHEVSENLWVNIYPNPTQESMLLQINNANINPVKLKIFNIAGQAIVNESKFNKNELRLSPQDFSAGMYLVEIERNGYIYRNKIVFE